ncbi:MAG: SDR family oxidoreductase [Pseudomonadota bacterium]
MKTLIVGASRGIGLELCKCYATSGAEVIATCRTSTPELANTGVRIIDGIDVENDDCGTVLQQALGDAQLDTLIHNSGILTREDFTDLDIQRIRKQFEVNTLGPLKVIYALRLNMRDGGKIGILTSRVGSIDDNQSGGIYGYRLSKAAANMLGKNLSLEFKNRGIAVANLHPGLVATEMTGLNGINPEVAAAGLFERMKNLDMNTTGRFWHAEGYELPW